MLSCIYNGRPFTTKEEGYTTKEKYQLGKQKQLLCPICKTSVYFCEDGERTAHFTHHKVGDCLIGKYRSYDYSTTKVHDNVVETFVCWIKAQFPDIPVYPDYLISNELISDIYFELGDVKIAIEIQFRNFNNPTFIKRRELYYSQNIKDIWFFVQESGEFSIGSPYQRTYYRTNKRELYFYQISESNCKVYKGFAREKWEEVGKDTLFNSVSVTVPIDHIKITNNGTLFIPELRQKYLQTLQEKRKINKGQREAQRVYREQLKQGSQRENEYSLHKKMQKYDQIVQEKAFLLEYKEYSFIYENDNEYLSITILYQGKENRIKYLILKKQVQNNEVYLTCIKDSEQDNMRYSININPFLDSMKKVRIQKYRT